MPTIPPESSKIVEIYLLIAQYPMLASSIREKMRSELFERGIITPERLEQEVEQKALLTQKLEGLQEPTINENAEQWDLRLHRVRRTLTDFYFTYNLPIELLQKIITDLLAQRHSGIHPQENLLFNPELAPLEMVLKQAEAYEALPEDQQAGIDHHLQELRVVLLKSLVSDQLAFIHIAKHWFTARDFNDILENRIGTGKIGGKAAGMLLAYKILQKSPPNIHQKIVLPRSFFIGANVMYDFMAMNNVEFVAQKYKTAEQISDEYPAIQDHYTHGRFPEEIADQLRDILRKLGKTPLIVRSSSLLEDNFGTSFAGKYASFFCPNQGTLKENLRDLTLAIRRTYASVYSPDALLYRRKMGLLDYDERMAILLQEVQGQAFNRYYFPALAGVAYSYSPIVWNPSLRPEEGFLRLVFGLGTRAVDRMADDYPRMVTLSHPQLRPEKTRDAMRYYSQHFADLIDLEKNEFATLPIEEILQPDFPCLRWLVSLDDGESLLPPLSFGAGVNPEQLVLTFEGLLHHTKFIDFMKEILTSLNREYQMPVDMEFTLSFSEDVTTGPGFAFHLLQCRPQSRWITEGKDVQPILAGLGPGDKLFYCSGMVPKGDVCGVEYIVLVHPDGYQNLESTHARNEIARCIGRVNKILEGHPFILIGPGRWGSSDASQGVPVTYADIFNTRALIELTSKQGGYASEPSHGTHFFQDLVEAQIYPLAISAENLGDYLNMDFINQSTDMMPVIFPGCTQAVSCIKVIQVSRERPGFHLEIAMDGQTALGYFKSAEVK